MSHRTRQSDTATESNNYARQCIDAFESEIANRRRELVDLDPENEFPELDLHNMIERIEAEHTPKSILKRMSVFLFHTKDAMQWQAIKRGEDIASEWAEDYQEARVRFDAEVNEALSEVHEITEDISASNPAVAQISSISSAVGSEIEGQNGGILGMLGNLSRLRFIPRPLLAMGAIGGAFFGFKHLEKAIENNPEAFADLPSDPEELRTFWTQKIDELDIVNEETRTKMVDAITSGQENITAIFSTDSSEEAREIPSEDDEAIAEAQEEDPDTVSLSELIDNAEESFQNTFTQVSAYINANRGTVYLAELGLIGVFASSSSARGMVGGLALNGTSAGLSTLKTLAKIPFQMGPYKLATVSAGLAGLYLLKDKLMAESEEGMENIRIPRDPVRLKEEILNEIDNELHELDFEKSWIKEVYEKAPTEEMNAALDSVINGFEDLREYSIEPLEFVGAIANSTIDRFAKSPDELYLDSQQEGLQNLAFFLSSQTNPEYENLISYLNNLSENLSLESEIQIEQIQEIQRLAPENFRIGLDMNEEIFQWAIVDENNLVIEGPNNLCINPNLSESDKLRIAHTFRSQHSALEAITRPITNDIRVTADKLQNAFNNGGVLTVAGNGLAYLGHSAYDGYVLGPWNVVKEAMKILPGGDHIDMETILCQWSDSVVPIMTFGTAINLARHKNLKRAVLRTFTQLAYPITLPLEAKRIMFNGGFGAAKSKLLAEFRGYFINPVKDVAGMLGGHINQKWGSALRSRAGKDQALLDGIAYLRHEATKGGGVKADTIRENLKKFLEHSDIPEEILSTADNSSVKIHTLDINGNPVYKKLALEDVDEMKELASHLENVRDAQSKEFKLARINQDLGELRELKDLLTKAEAADKAGSTPETRAKLKHLQNEANRRSLDGQIFLLEHQAKEMSKEVDEFRKAHKLPDLASAGNKALGESNMPGHLLDSKGAKSIGGMVLGAGAVLTANQIAKLGNKYTERSGLDSSPVELSPEAELEAQENLARLLVDIQNTYDPQLDELFLPQNVKVMSDSERSRRIKQLIHTHKQTIPRVEQYVKSNAHNLKGLFNQHPESKQALGDFFELQSNEDSSQITLKYMGIDNFGKHLEDNFRHIKYNADAMIAGQNPDKVGEVVTTTAMYMLPVTGTYMDSKDAYYAFKRGDFEQGAISGAFAVVGLACDITTVAGVGVAGRGALTAFKAGKGLKRLSKGADAWKTLRSGDIAARNTSKVLRAIDNSTILKSTEKAVMPMVGADVTRGSLNGHFNQSMTV